MAKPREIAAVQKVLYEPNRRRALEDAVVSIEGVLNLSGHGSGLQCDPSEICRPSTDYVAGAQYADRVATLLRAIHDDLAHVHVNAADKTLLRTALAEYAASWQARANLWRAPRIGKVEDEVATITAHYRRSIYAFARLVEYLR